MLGAVDGVDARSAERDLRSKLSYFVGATGLAVALTITGLVVRDWLITLLALGGVAFAVWGALDTRRKLRRLLGP
jgi:hypothetical protein